MAGIRDVAKRAGVSPSTVSRTLSGVAFVETETRERVWKAVNELNYKPNLAARSLKQGGSRLIGLIIPDITNPYYPEAVKYLELCAASAGYSLILCDALGDVEKEKEYFEKLKYLFVDGILYLSSTESVDHIKPYIGEIPMVIVNRTFDVEAPCFNIDNRDAVTQAIEYLIQNGHRKIALYSSDKTRQYNQERLTGCLVVMEKHGLPEREEYIIRNVSSEEDACQRTIKLMTSQDPPTAIFLFSDSMADGVYSGIRTCGLTIPSDISVIGFDDIPHAKYMNPPLTTIRHSLADAATAIFDCLINQMQTQTCAPHNTTYFKGQLIQRESVRSLF